MRFPTVIFSSSVQQYFILQCSILWSWVCQLRGCVHRAVYSKQCPYLRVGNSIRQHSSFYGTTHLSPTVTSSPPSIPLYSLEPWLWHVVSSLRPRHRTAIVSLTHPMKGRCSGGYTLTIDEFRIHVQINKVPIMKGGKLIPCKNKWNSSILIMKVVLTCHHQWE